MIALYEELWTMLGVLVPMRAVDERLSPIMPILPDFVRRALSALFGRH